MKTSLTLLAGLLLVSNLPLCGEDLATLDGQQYKNIKISAEKPDSIKVMHDGGISTIQKKVLPADFVALHQLSAATEPVLPPDMAAKQALLEKFVASTPTFSSKDGKEFKSSQIKGVEPNGLSIHTDSGPVRVKFTDLPSEVRAAFHYDAGKAAEYEKALEARNKNAVGAGQRMANAASVVDKRPSHARLSFVRNIGTGWICHMQFLREVQKEVTTAHQGSALSTTTIPSKARMGRIGGRPSEAVPTVTYEITHVDETVVASDEGEVMVYGLPDYGKLKPNLQEQWQWSGHVYWIGLFEKDQPANNGQIATKVTIQAYTLDRAKAVKLVAMNGVQRKYRADGEPEPDTLAPGDPDALARRDEHAKVRKALDAGEYDQAVELLQVAQLQDRHDPDQLLEFQKNLVARVQEKAAKLSRQGEGWEAAAAYAGRFVEPRFTYVVGEHYDTLQANLQSVLREGDKRLYDEILKTKSNAALDRYFLKAPVKSMMPEVAAYRRWLQNREAPHKPICRLVKIEWSDRLKKGLTGGTAIKLYVDGVGDQRNDRKEDNNRTGSTVDSEGLRVAKLSNTTQSKKLAVVVQVFHVNLLGAWERLSTFSKELSAEELAKQSGATDDAGNKFTFEVDGIIKEPFLPTVWRVSQ